MWESLMGPLLQGGFDLYQDKRNRQHQDIINRQNIDFGLETNEMQERVANASLKQQEEFAKMGIQWRVADAVAAGLHPLSALGVSPASSSPVSVGGASVDLRSSPGTALSEMGQNLGRAVSAAMDQTRQANLDLVRAQTDESRARAKMYEAEAIEKVSNKPGVPFLPSPLLDKGRPPSKKLYPPYGTHRTSPTTTAQDVQDEYGDVVEWIYGASRLANDLGMNFIDAVRSVNPW